jgi:hypothetical protein
MNHPRATFTNSLCSCGSGLIRYPLADCVTGRRIGEVCDQCKERHKAARRAIRGPKSWNLGPAGGSYVVPNRR